MKRRIVALTATCMTMLGSVACAPTYDVQTLAAPEASITSLRSFRVLPVPQRRDGRQAGGSYDPMVNNSITNRALRETITQTLTARGYVVNEQRPDFAVAVYASADEELDVTAWDYGYPYWPRWRYPLPEERVTTYTEGTVVVDVVDPGSRELWWRGSGTARLSREPARDTRELQKVAEAIVKRFPRAAAPAVTANR